MILNICYPVYDFDEGEEGGVIDSENEDDKGKIVKLIPRKSQVVTQAHMCNYCNYTSPKRYLLSRHMKSHSEERPHKCSVCERGFKTLASLQNHVNTHTGVKPHVCKFCDAAFTTSGMEFGVCCILFIINIDHFRWISPSRALPSHPRETAQV